MAESAYGRLGPDFWRRRPLVGMVHLGALPGSPRDRGNFESVLRRAEEDARALAEGGADALMVENFFDAPFSRDTVPPITVAALTRAALRVRDAAPSLPLGINCLRNDAVSAISIAHAVGARFVRINVFVGAAVTDQGIIQGQARAAVLCRRHLDADIALWADVFVKHAAQLGDGSVGLADAARDAVHRGLADALIVSGAATGAGTSPQEIQLAVDAVPGVPILVGSGFSAETADRLLAAGAAGAIVGTSIKREGKVEEPVEAGRVRALRAAMQPEPV